jgi:hypothetical protein
VVAGVPGETRSHIAHPVAHLSVSDWALAGRNGVAVQAADLAFGDRPKVSGKKERPQERSLRALY